MPKYEHFEDLPVWREAAKLYNRVLDLLEKPGLPVSSSFKNQLDRAALSVSNNIAEGFDRVTTNELISFIAIAKGSASEVRSMMAVIQNRTKLQTYSAEWNEIRKLAESCAKQLSAWMMAIENSPVKGKRHLTEEMQKKRNMEQSIKDFRHKFLISLTPEHPLYNTEETRRARGEIS